jgi:branched-chain amino acid aminotransferase
VGEIQLYPAETYRKGIPIITSSLRRIGPECFDVRIKSLNYLNNVLAKIEAQRAGCMEAVLLNAQGYVAECTVDNIFVVRGGTLLTPATTEGALEGITRASVLETADMIGMPWKEARLTQYDLYNADECFITGTGAELMPVTSVDGRKVGPGEAGPWTVKLWENFKRAVREGAFAD